MARRTTFTFFRRKVPLKGDRGFDGVQGTAGMVGPQGPQGPTGPQGSSGTQGIQGLQGPSGLPNITSINTNPGRTLNTTYQVHASRPAVVVYSVQLHAQLSALGTSVAQCDLLSDAGSPPVAMRDVARLSHQIGLGITINDTIEVTDSLTTVVNAGDNVRLVPTTSNGGTVTIISQTEIVL